MAEAGPQLPAGGLQPSELAAVLAAIPADITFVDADNVVRYLSDYRIFSRSPEALGRDVLECHIEGTRPRVARLIAELRDGWRDEAILLADKGGRGVHLRYVAVRDTKGTYLGCLQIAQWSDELAMPA